MKALDKLNFILKLIESNMTNKLRLEMIHEKTHQVIVELQELEDRKCINCKFSSIRFNIDCNLINRLDLPYNFCCNRWTQK